MKPGFLVFDPSGGEIYKKNIDRIEMALACFRKGYNCSQAIMAGYAPCLGLDYRTALGVSAGFGGGMGCMAETCGAVTGAFMVIGLKYGAVSAADGRAKQKTYRIVREFAARFLTRNGSVTCRDLLGCDISLPGGMEAARARNLHSTVCVKFVRDAAEILEELIDWD